ncbi:MAG: thioredoxin family protein [Natronincolaceae bacterium]|jgi:alkyl hydroperoxide reductase subunit AhpF|nr:thioredoxin family protein [Bacillota bacterium]NLK90053.1 thioredoxin family protein [Clostridiales bacterium]
MSLQQLFKNGESFEMFAPEGHDVNMEKLLEIYDGIEIDEELFNEIKSIDESIYILAFAELWCSDCIINLPALKKINDINPNIMFRILPKEDNEKYMGNYKTDTKLKIPTFIILNDKFEEIGAFVENPKILDSIISKGNQVEVVVAKRKYQKGEYVDETIKEIVDIITKK